jgi:hypothetical protein
VDGISAAKSRISRSIRIHLTKGGRQRKIGRIFTGGGCLVLIMISKGRLAVLFKLRAFLGLNLI